MAILAGKVQTLMRFCGISTVSTLYMKHKMKSLHVIKPECFNWLDFWTWHVMSEMKVCFHALKLILWQQTKIRIVDSIMLEVSTILLNILFNMKSQGKY